MRPALFQPSPDPGRETLRRRALALGLTIIAHILLLLMLLRLAPQQFRLPEPPRLTTFSLMPAPEAATKRAATADRSVRKSGGAPKTPPPPRPEKPVPIPPPPVPTPPLNILALSRQDMAAADLAQLHSDRGERESGQGDTTGEGAGPDSGSVYGPSQGGGGGERLYNAEWYREPTDAELAFYLPKTGPHVGWAMIACQTVERYHVDNCRELGDSPAGAGLARGIRQAAWQFLVRPPRVGGKVMVGAWVRIRIDFTEKGIK